MIPEMVTHKSCTVIKANNDLGKYKKNLQPYNLRPQIRRLKINCRVKDGIKYKFINDKVRI